MIQVKRILQSDIRHACGDTYFSRGKKYFDDNRVLDLDVEQDNATRVVFSSSISGSRGNFYEQSVRIDWKRDYQIVSIDGDCSCPMEFNCKHVAAACLQYMQLSSQGIGSSAAIPSCLEWLNNFDKPKPGADTSQEFITYILKPGKTAHVLPWNFL